MTRSPHRLRGRALPCMLAGLALLPFSPSLGCAATTAEGPRRPLPSYVGHSAELFDDAIEPAAVGISLDLGADPRSDRLLRERTQVGDATLRVRVTTVTTKEDGDATRYVLGIKTLESYAAQFPPGDTFEVTVGKSSPSAGLLKALQGELAGKTFVAFVRAYALADGDSELHFHLAPDSKPEIAAVKDAIALAGL